MDYGNLSETTVSEETVVRLKGVLDDLFGCPAEEWRQFTSNKPEDDICQYTWWFDTFRFVLCREFYLTLSEENEQRFSRQMNTEKDVWRMTSQLRRFLYFSSAEFRARYTRERARALLLR